MKTAFIGLGAMGRPMATNLARAGCLHQVWNRSVEKATAFVADNKQVGMAATLTELAQHNELIFTCVSADDDLREIIELMKPALRSGSIIVDTSTVSAETSSELAEVLTGMGVTFLDAPVSGGVEGALRAPYR